MIVFSDRNVDDLIDVHTLDYEDGWHQATCYACGWTVEGYESVIEDSSYEHVRTRHTVPIQEVGSMNNFFLIMNSEDGGWIKRLGRADLDNVLATAHEYGIDHFMDRYPENNISEWPEGAALLITGDVIIPRAVTTAWAL